MRPCLFLLVALAACGKDGKDGKEGELTLEFEAIDVEGGLDMATDLHFLPGETELLVAGKDGGVVHLRLEGDRAERLGEFAVPGVYSDLDCGLVSLAIDPDFADNRYLYAGVCVSMTESAILRLTFRPDDYDSIPATAVEILRAGDPAAERPWHNVGSLGFDSTGAMWALLGDKTRPENGQDLNDDLGSVVRIRPSTEPGVGGHTPAPDNPFLDQSGRDPDVYAYGLRSPWRGSLDSAGRLWIGDVGANLVEEIDLLESPGDNFGWADSEGPCESDCAGQRDPVVWWNHDASSPYVVEDPEARPTSRRVAWVGVEPRPAEPDPYAGDLSGQMLFGDFCVGFVRALEVDAAGQVVSNRHLGHLAHASSWGQAADGFLYATTFGQCETVEAVGESRLWRAVPVRR